jgi:HEAT repeat protein
MVKLMNVVLAGALLVMATGARAGQEVTARLEKEAVVVEVDGKLFTQYKFVNQFGKKPYFWPLAGPVSGKSVTTESSDPYPHHNSMWFGCDHINGGDYWHHQNPKGRQRSLGPRLLIASGERVVFEDVCDWNPPDSKTVMRDFRRVTVTAPDAATRIIDFVVVWVPLEKVHITKTNHSLFALRMTPELSVKGGGTMVTSNGETGEKGTFGKTAPWMDYFGERGGVTEGAAILQHPSNRWYPSPWFTRDYGFFSPTPMFWLEKGSIDLLEGEPTTLAYRVVVHAGDTKKADLASHFARYSEETPVLPVAYIASVMNRLKTVVSYEYGQSRKDLMVIEEIVNRVSGDSDLSPRVAAQLASLLSDDKATGAARHFICRQLALVGGDESVPALAKLLEGDDESLAGTACFALHRITSPAAAEALRDALPRLKGRTLLAAMTALGAKRDAGAVGLLRETLAGEDGAAREIAAAALARIGTAPAVDALLKAWTGGRAGDAVLADAVVSGATGLLESGAVRDAERAFRAVYDGTRANGLQLAALRGLVTANPETGAASLDRALSSKDATMREGGILLIAEVQGEPVTRLATARLPRLPPAEQIKLLAALESRGDPLAAADVALLLDSPDAGVRSAACRALGSLGGPSVVPALVDKLAGEPGERDMAAEALSRMGVPGMTGGLLVALDTVTGDTRSLLVRVLAKRGDPAAAPALLRLAGDETVSRHVLKALGVLGTVDELETLICELGTDEGTATDRKPYEVCIAAICRRLAGDASASGTCLAALPKAKPAGRASLYRVLGRLQDEEALAVIVKGTAEADETVRDAAIRALVDWPRESALKPILAVAKSADGLTHNVLALRGYARLLKSLTDKTPVELKPLYDAGLALARRPEERQLLDYDVKGVVIRDLKVKGQGSYKIHQAGLRKGARWSSDREYTFEDVPMEVADATYLESVMDDRNVGGSEFVSFVVDVPVDVYVAYDSRCSQLPGWLRGWERLKSRIKPPAKTSCTLVLHRKRFDKGRVVLGGCAAPGCSAMYVVAVKKAR